MEKDPTKELSQSLKGRGKAGRSQRSIKKNLLRGIIGLAVVISVFLELQMPLFYIMIRTTI